MGVFKEEFLSNMKSELKAELFEELYPVLRESFEERYNGTLWDIKTLLQELKVSRSWAEQHLLKNISFRNYCELYTDSTKLIYNAQRVREWMYEECGKKID